MPLPPSARGPAGRARAAVWVGVGVLAVVSTARAADDPTFADHVPPLRVEAGPVLSPALGPVPANELFVAAGVLYADRERGRARYETVAARLVLGGEWSPAKLPIVGLGGEIVALQVHSLAVDLPPAIDERESFADLGMLRLHGRVRVFDLARGPLELALTPFLRIGLPTDTARNRSARQLPLRRVLDDRVMSSPYFPIEPGIAVGGTLGPVSFYTHQAPVFVPLHDGPFQFAWSMHYGAGIRIGGMVEPVLESSGLLRTTEDYAGRRLVAFSLDPGLRLVRGAFSYEIACRVGLTPDARAPYGKVTAGFAFAWRP